MVNIYSHGPVMRNNPFKYQVIEYIKDFPHGTPNSIVASAATMRGCMSEYKRHLHRYEVAGIKRNIVKTVFLCDGVPFDVSIIN